MKEIISLSSSFLPRPNEVAYKGDPIYKCASLSSRACKMGYNIALGRADYH